jgi:uncharacterized membrane protein
MAEEQTLQIEGDGERGDEAKTWATVVYALQAASVLVAVTFIAGVILNYLKRGDVAGTWVASHFRWQIRTFWYSLLWTFVAFLTSFALIGYFVFVANLVWVIYRIVKGWLFLSEDRPMYAVVHRVRNI